MALVALLIARFVVALVRNGAIAILHFPRERRRTGLTLRPCGNRSVPDEGAPCGLVPVSFRALGDGETKRKTLRRLAGIGAGLDHQRFVVGVFGLRLQDAAPNEAANR